MFQRYILTCLALSCIAPAAVQAQEVWALRRKLLASDAQDHSEFGYAVGVSADRIVIGAHLMDELGRQRSDAGSVYVLDLATQQQLFKLNATPIATGEWFGCAVAVQDRVAVVGARNNSDLRTMGGAAYVFDLTTGQQHAELHATDGADRDWFGHSVSLSGRYAIIGAIGSDVRGPESGAAYVFDALSGSQMRRLFAPDGLEGDLFGCSVGISGDRAIVGARDARGRGTRSGAAYVIDVETGQLIYKLVPEDLEAYDSFGASVAIDGNLALVGSPKDDDRGDGAGAAYLFDLTDGQMISKFTAPDGRPEQWFGWSVALHADRAVVGALYDNSIGYQSGSAYIFDALTGEFVHKIRALDGGTRHEFGGAVAIHGAQAVVGARRNDDRGAKTGAAYLFQGRVVDYTLDVQGECPGMLQIAWQDATPSSVQVLLFSSAQGTHRVPIGTPCGGTMLGLSPSQFQVVTPPGPFNSGATGAGSFMGQAGPAACRGYLQLLDAAACHASNVALIP